MHGTTLTSVGNVHHLLQPNENEDFTMLKGGWGLRPCYIASGITSNVYSNLNTLGWQSVLFQVEIDGDAFLSPDTMAISGKGQIQPRKVLLL